MRVILLKKGNKRDLTGSCLLIVMQFSFIKSILTAKWLIAFYFHISRQTFAQCTFNQLKQVFSFLAHLHSNITIANIHLDHTINIVSTCQHCGLCGKKFSKFYPNICDAISPSSFQTLWHGATIGRLIYDVYNKE